MITRDMVELWVGSDTLRSGVIDILVELATGEYDIEQMRRHPDYEEVKEEEQPKQETNKQKVTKNTKEG